MAASFINFYLILEFAKEGLFENFPLCEILKQIVLNWKQDFNWEAIEKIQT